MMTGRKSDISAREQADIAIALLNGTARHKIARSRSITEGEVMACTMHALSVANAQVIAAMCAERALGIGSCLRVPDLRARRGQFLPQLISAYAKLAAFPEMKGRRE